MQKQIISQNWYIANPLFKLMINFLLFILLQIIFAKIAPKSFLFVSNQFAITKTKYWRMKFVRSAITTVLQPYYNHITSLNQTYISRLQNQPHLWLANRNSEPTELMTNIASGGAVLIKECQCFALWMAYIYLGL